MPTLRWLTRDDDIRAVGSVPYRLLEEVPGLGHGDRDTGNMLIQGDNLDALKALLPFFAGRVKCIFIDPPYNTRSAGATGGRADAVERTGGGQEGPVVTKHGARRIRSHPLRAHMASFAVCSFATSTWKLER